MGINIFLSGGSSESTRDLKANVNPSPYNFIINKIEFVGSLHLVEVIYPNCTNYEGKKILLIKDDIKNIKKRLDPHFNEDGKLIARFQPTKKGWELGLELLNNLIW